MKRVLVVDDTKNIRMMLTKCLELEGYEVITAVDGKQALEMFTMHAFDLAFLDIKLPEIRGTEVLKRIRDIGIKTPVIIITAYATVKNAIDCTNLGAVAYIQKPFSAEKIKAVLKELDNVPLHSEPGDSILLNFINDAKVYLDKGIFDKALESLKKAISMDLNNPEIYLLISKSYDGMGDKDNSKRFYQFYKCFV
ncbi:response regulator [Pseudobacteroides cellulosolvens]|uniref:Stage 0 sporulation protein A homolog n=1 Tax=Pseudobacteroides cellulosolvens ATCC 35603 = DSM 2933 TaxID=398512 RepID=A0A0L6JX21_9FIRM|nr:response regulator [Pseudobacteroides cellulosolvens]KNY30274.1 response regulator receiver protein [Pseudobacteroides cellulosolvens ATCC 35603 = DSM 2933]